MNRLLSQITKVLVGVKVAALVAEAYFLTDTEVEFKIAMVKRRMNWSQKTRGYS